MPRHTRTGEFSLYHVSSLQRPVSLIAQAVGILARYGGSLWLADPAYTFTGSDGTGAAGDNSDAGYVRDLCATYGPELVTNGDLSQGSTGWTLTQPTSGVVGVVNGRLRINSADGSLANAVQYNTLTIGKLYQVTGNANVASGSVNVFLGSGTSFQVSASGDFSFVGVCSGTANMELKRFGAVACDASFDNISVREIIGRPLFQATTGFKPKLKRVPKKLGPELVTNGDFAAGKAGWVERSGATYVVSAGAASITFSASNGSRVDQFVSVAAGKIYEASVDVASTSAGVYLNVIQGASPFTAVAQKVLSTGRVSVQFTAPPDGAYVQINKLLTTAGGETCTVDNISVREVLEWGWAWVFDGTDDGLATVAQPAVSSETIIAVSQRGASSAFSKYIVGRVSSADTSTGTAIYQGASDMKPYGLCVGNIYGPHADQPVHVISAVAAPTSFKVRQSGVQVGTGSLGAYTSNSNPISIGKAVNASRYFNAGVFAAAYAPAAIPDAGLLIVERAMAQLGGITI